MLSQEKFEFRSSQIASDAIWDKIVVETCDNNHTQFQDFWGGGGIPAPPPLYETLHAVFGELADYGSEPFN